MTMTTDRIWCFRVMTHNRPWGNVLDEQSPQGQADQRLNNSQPMALSMFPCSIARRTGLISYFFSLLFPKPLLAGTALWKLQSQKKFPKPVNWLFHQGSDSWFANHQTKGRTGPFAWSQTIRMPLSDYWQWSTVKGQCVGNSSSIMTSPSDFENPEASSLQLAFKRQGGHLDYRHRSEGSLGMPGIWTIGPWMNRSQFCAWTPNRECNRGFDRFWQ